MATTQNWPTKQLTAWSPLAGGGWNSHSILTGLLGGAIEASSQGLSSLFSNVGSFTANSGGTWFLSHIGYSAAFLNALESKQGRDNYNTTGYNGQIRKAFTALSQHGNNNRTIKSIASALGTETKALTSTGPGRAFDYTSGLLNNALEINDLNWRSFVDQFVYGYANLQDLQSARLDTPRQSWAFGKDFSFATTLASHPSFILTQDRPSKTSLTTAAEPSQLPSWWNSQHSPGVLPLLIVSDAETGTQSIQPYAEFPFGDVNLTFTQSTDADTQLRKGKIKASFRPDLSIIDTTTASSSAAGAFSMPDSYGKAPILKSARQATASYLRQLAPLASFHKNTLQTPKELKLFSESTRLDDITTGAYARLADGGYADNTAVSYGLRQLQREKGASAPFEITLFMNSSSDASKMPHAPIGDGLTSGFRLSPSVAKLFGLDANGKQAKDGLIEFESLPTKPLMPSSWIFNANAWKGIKSPTWSFSADDGTYSSQYFRLPVTTVRNELFGIHAGQKGSLHLFATNNSQSLAAPVTPGILDEYDQNFNFGRLAMSSGGGWIHLAEALGLSVTAQSQAIV